MGLGNGWLCGPTGPFLRSLLKPLCYPNLSAFIGEDGQPPLDLASNGRIILRKGVPRFVWVLELNHFQQYLKAQACIEEDAEGRLVDNFAR